MDEHKDDPLYQDLKGKKVLYLPEFDLDNSMVARWRHLWPSKHLHEYGVDWDIQGAMEPITYRPTKEERDTGRPDVEIDMNKGYGPDNPPGVEALRVLKNDVDSADIVVFGRTSNLFTRELFDYAKEQKKVVGYEVDDLVFGPRGIFNEGRDPNEKYNHADAIEEQIRGADFVTTTTRGIRDEAAELRESYDDIYIVKNRVDVDSLRDLVEDPINHENKDGKKVRVGWAGGRYHLRRLNDIKEAYKFVNMRNPGKVKFVFKGFDEESLNTPAEMDTFNELKGYFDEHGVDYEFHGPTPQNNWIDYYRDLKNLDIDVFHAPGGLDGEYVGKSELKYLEAAIVGAPIVVPDIGGHSDAVRHRENGMLIRPTQQIKGFDHSIDELVKNADLRTRLARNARRNLIEDYDVRQSSHELATIFREQLIKHGGLERKVENV